MSPPAPTVRAEHALSTDHGSTCNQTGTRSLLQLSLFSYFLQDMCEFRLCNHSTDNSANSAFTKFFEDHFWHDLRRSNQRNRLLKQKIHQWSRPAGTDPKQTMKACNRRIRLSSFTFSQYYGENSCHCNTDAYSQAKP